MRLPSKGDEMMNATTVTDPVCGMTIDPARAAGNAVFQGETFHFCAASCKAAFEAAPQQYVAQPEPSGEACCGSACCRA
jgi:Cu+-exporting ATPase